jgi:hypothetical protein
VGKGATAPRHSATLPRLFLERTTATKKQTTILAASDGGQKDDHGSFGWVMGTKDEVIWDCEGIARGYPMQSYRAEGYGRMSLLLFLAHYIRFYNIKPEAGLRVISYYDSPQGSESISQEGRGFLRLVL